MQIGDRIRIVYCDEDNDNPGKWDHIFKAVWPVEQIQGVPVEPIIIDECSVKPCSDCKGTGQYIGLGFAPPEPCLRCGGSGNEI